MQIPLKVMKLITNKKDEFEIKILSVGFLKLINFF